MNDQLIAECQDVHTQKFLNAAILVGGFAAIFAIGLVALNGAIQCLPMYIIDLFKKPRKDSSDGGRTGKTDAMRFWPDRVIKHGIIGKKRHDGIYVIGIEGVANGIDKVLLYRGY